MQIYSFMDALFDNCDVTVTSQNLLRLGRKDVKVKDLITSERQMEK